jgi:hypothetical protein
METRKMVLQMSAGVSMNSAEFLNVPVDMSEDELSAYAWECAVEFARTYGLEPESAREFYPEEDDEDEDWYGNARFTDDIEGWFEEYDSDKHDGLVVGYSSTPKFRDM